MTDRSSEKSAKKIESESDEGVVESDENEGIGKNT